MKCFRLMTLIIVYVLYHVQSSLPSTKRQKRCANSTCNFTSAFICIYTCIVQLCHSCRSSVKNQVLGVDIRAQTIYVNCVVWKTDTVLFVPSLDVAPESHQTRSGYAGKLSSCGSVAWRLKCLFSN